MKYTKVVLGHCRFNGYLVTPSIDIYLAVATVCDEGKI